MSKEENMENKWFEKLTDAQKEKLRGLNGSSEDLIAFCKQEKLDLPDDLLDAVSGGKKLDGENCGDFCSSFCASKYYPRIVD